LCTHKWIKSHPHVLQIFRKTATNLNPEGGLEEEWNAFTGNLKLNFICLEEEVANSLSRAKNVKSGTYSVKLGYLALVEGSLEGGIKWWWKSIWKWNAPEKMRVIFRLSMEEKILTWDAGPHRGWIGPSRCSLCRLNGELAVHLFLQCPYAKQVWNQVVLLLRIPLIPLEGSMEEWLDLWRREVVVREVELLPSFFVYFIWWSRNLCIFQGKYIPAKVVTGLILKLVVESKEEPDKAKNRIAIMPELIEGMPWGVFDGVSQVHPPHCGVGVVLYIS
jgi:hypothetical protein